MSKFHFLQPLKIFTSDKICDYLLRYVFYTFGVPESILTDNGSQFKSGQFKAFLTRFGISHISTAIYSPQANASERLNRSVLAAVRAYVGQDHTNWDKQLSEISGSLRANSTQLVHFDKNLPLVLATGASSFCIGVVLLHIQPDGKETPIVFASKTLDKHQVKYSQIEKEGLPIIFGVQRFRQYLYCRKFTLITDHRPLVTIFSPGKPLP